MSGYTRIAIFILVVLLGVFFFYKTSAPQDVPQPEATFGGVSLRLDYATTSAQRERGLGGIKSIPSDYGMLFAFPEDGLYGFWMKDTLVALDIFWLNDKGQVVHFEKEVSPDTFPRVFYPAVPARYVLETAAGFARDHAIRIGTPLLLKTFPTVTK
jgi:uncharacterized membrane protein (UPF0127 family)